jgi:hypothetical protein
MSNHLPDQPKTVLKIKDTLLLEDAFDFENDSRCSVIHANVLTND